MNAGRIVLPRGRSAAAYPQRVRYRARNCGGPRAIHGPHKVSILIIYGDNIPEKPVDLPAQDSWRARLEMARLWQSTVNKHRGDVTVVHLPTIGIKGNTHFPSPTSITCRLQIWFQDFLPTRS